jgi:hypothetical protein
MGDHGAEIFKAAACVFPWTIPCLAPIKGRKALAPQVVESRRNGKLLAAPERVLVFPIFRVGLATDPTDGK